MPVNRHNGSWLKGIKHPLAVVRRTCAQVVVLTESGIRLGLGGEGIEKGLGYYHVNTVPFMLVSSLTNGTYCNLTFISHFGTF